MKHNSIENDFTDAANIKIFWYKIALTLRSPVTILCTITFNIQEFYVYMEIIAVCSMFIWNLEQTAIISLYKIN